MGIDCSQLSNSLSQKEITENSTSDSHSKSIKALSALNFLAADIPNGFGPFLAMYLRHTMNWNPAFIGMVLASCTLSNLVGQIPLSAWLDHCRYKQRVIAAILLISGLSIFILTHSQRFKILLGVQLIVGAAWVLYQPAINSISVGLVGPAHLSKQLSRNEAFNHGGNFISAMIAGLLGQYFRLTAIFDFLIVQCIIGAILAFQIRQKDTERHVQEQAILEVQDSKEHLAHVWAVLKDKRLLIFSFSSLLFHLANAAMLPLVSQVLILSTPKKAALATSACIIVAQLVMVPMALATGFWAERIGRKPVFALGFLVLALRGFLFTVSLNPYYLVAVQGLDGIGAAIFGVLLGVVAADLSKGKGRFNLIQGVIITGMGIGATGSQLLGGWLAKVNGYNTAFLALSGASLIGCIFFWILMPETKLPVQAKELEG